jgi:hypothetical protein
VCVILVVKAALKYVIVFTENKISFATTFCLITVYYIWTCIISTYLRHIAVNWSKIAQLNNNINSCYLLSINCSRQLIVCHTQPIMLMDLWTVWQAI